MRKREETITAIKEGLKTLSFSVSDLKEMELASKSVRSYAPEIAKLFNNDKNLAIFIAQVRFWWFTKGCNPFFKYSSPCQDAAPGDSWLEELAFTPHELRTCKETVTTEYSTPEEAARMAQDSSELNNLITYHTDRKNKTTWHFNDKLYYSLWYVAITEFQTCESHTSRDVNLTHQTSETHSSLNTEPLHNNTEQSFDEIFEKEKKETKPRKEVKPKIRNPKQTSFVKSRGSKMPVDFSLKESIMIEVESLGLDPNLITTQAAQFYNYYTNGKGRSATRLDWDREFIDGWIPRAIENGYLTGNKKDANAERLERLQTIASGSVFDRVGTEDLGELAAKLRERSQTSSNGRSLGPYSRR